MGSLIPMHQIVSPRIAAGCERLLVVVAVFEQARRDDRVAGEVAGAQEPPARERLEIDQRLHRCAVPAAEFGRVAGDHPAVVEQRRLPVAHELRYELGFTVGIALEVVALGESRAAYGHRGTRRARRERPRLAAPRPAARVLPLDLTSVSGHPSRRSGARARRRDLVLQGVQVGERGLVLGPIRRPLCWR